MRRGRAIALASLLASLVGVAPVVALTGMTPAIAQPVDPRKAEGDANGIGCQYA